MTVDRSRRVATGASRTWGAAGAVVVLAAAVGAGPPWADIGAAASGLLFFGFVGIAARGDPGGAIERLTGTVERLGAGELDVDLATDRDDEVGQLYAAVDGLASTMRERRRVFDVQRRALGAERDRLAALFEHATDAVAHVELDDDVVVSGVNPQFEALFGRDEPDARGESLGDLGVPPGAVEDLWRQLRAGEVAERTVRGETAEGPTEFAVRLVPIGDGAPPEEGYAVVTPVAERAGGPAGAAGAGDAAGAGSGQGAEGAARGRPDIPAGARESAAGELGRQRSLLDSIFEQVPVHLFVKDREGRHLRVSSAYLSDEDRRDPEEFVGKTDLEILSGAFARETYEDDMAVVESGEPLLEKEEYVPSIGEWHLTSKVPWRDDDGEVRGLIGIAVEVTERKESRRQLEAIVENTTNPIYIKDRDGAYRLVNDAVAGLFGLDRSDVVGKRDDELFDPESVAEIRADDERVLETGERVTRQVEVTVDGEEYVFLDDKYPYRDEDGEVVGVVGVSQDVTDRVEAERRLRERERELRAYKEYTDDVLDAVDDVFYVLDGEGQFQRWNETLAGVTGYDDDEVGSTYGTDFVAEADRPALVAALEEVLETGRTRVEADLVTSDGTTTPYEFVAATVETPDGERHVAGIGRDVSAREARERELARTRDLLQQAGRVAQVGGWEVDATADPPEVTWTAELYDIHDVAPGTEIDLEATLQFYHPADRAFIREQFRRAVEAGEGYDMEVRALTADDDVRWVRAIGEPVVRDGEVVAVRGSVQDVTGQKEREMALRSLHEAARGLLGTETEPDVAQLVVETAEDVLAIPGVAVYLLDPEANVLEPVSYTSAYADLAGGAPAVPVGDADSPVWSCFVTESPTVLDGDGGGDGEPFDDVGGGLLVPIGDHGVLAVAAPSTAVDGATRRLAETLVATAEAAFDRLESESALRRRDEELAARNRRLGRQVQVTDIIRTVDQSLVGAGSREEIESAVCRRLLEAEDVSFAWIAGADAEGSELVPRAWAGANRGYLDAIGLGAPGDGIEPAVRTARTGEPAVVGNVVEGLNDAAWRKAALARDFHSVVAVPLAVDEYVYGVLAVYADEPGAFGDLELAVFGELGENIANSIAAVETRRALHADTLVELTLRLDEPDEFLARVARETGARVEYEGLGTASAEETRLFFTTAGTPDDDVSAVLADLVSASDHRLVAEFEEERLFEATVGGEVLPARLVRHGASPVSIRASEETLDVVVDVPATTDVRGFVDMLREGYPDVELVGRRDVERTTHTREELTASLLEALTDRQREVLRTAYLAGFFEWPRESTGEEVAEMLGVSQPTVNRHLRLAQGRLLDGLFERHPSG